MTVGPAGPASPKSPIRLNTPQRAPVVAPGQTWSTSGLTRWHHENVRSSSKPVGVTSQGWSLAWVGSGGTVGPGVVGPVLASGGTHGVPDAPSSPDTIDTSRLQA